MAVKNWLMGSWLMGSLAIILMLLTVSGCQPTFMTKDMFTDAHAPLPPLLEDTNAPITDPLTKITAAPATVTKADRPPRYLTLQEALAIALESGTVSGRAVSNLLLIQAPGGGPPSTNGIGFSVTGQNDSIRVLMNLPAQANLASEVAVSRFDGLVFSGINWTGLDGLSNVPNLVNNFQNTSLFGSGGANNGGQGARYEAAFVKPFANGGVAVLTWQTDYRMLNNNGVNPVPAFGLLNPQYSTRVGFGYELPLWRDAGVAINQLLPIFPSPSGVAFGPSGATTAFGQHQNKLNGLPGGADGILIARVKFDQSRAHFENNVSTLLANVELAYWNLYNKYGQLYSFEDSVRIIHKAWQEARDRHVLGGGEQEKGSGPSQYFQTEGQYHEFRGERLRALDEVIEAERNLRSILGLPVEDGSRLVPITPPTLAESKPNYEACIQEALTSRSDLAWARQELLKAQFALTVQKNNLHPDLRAFFRYEPFGDGSTLTGNGTYIDGSGITQPSNAFRSLMSGRLADYQFGLALNMPLGFRAEFAAVRSARLELVKTYLLVKDWENQIVYQVAQEYQEVDHAYNRIKVHRLERQAYAESVQKQLDAVELGKSKIGDPQFLESHRRYTAAIVKEYQAIADYNSRLARLEWAKGSLMRYDNVHIADGAVPQLVQIRAVEYEKERSKSLALMQRPDALYKTSPAARIWATPDHAELPIPDDGPAEDKLPAPKKVAEPARHEQKAPGALPPITTISVTGEAEAGPSLPKVTTLPESGPQPLPPITTRPVEEKETEVKPIEFRPMQPAPAPLPKLENAPLPVVPMYPDVVFPPPVKNGVIAPPMLITSVVEPSKTSTPAFVLIDDGRSRSTATAPTVVRGASPQIEVIPDHK